MGNRGCLICGLFTLLDFDRKIKLSHVKWCIFFFVHFFSFDFSFTQITTICLIQIRFFLNSFGFLHKNFVNSLQLWRNIQTYRCVCNAWLDVDQYFLILVFICYILTLQEISFGFLCYTNTRLLLLFLCCCLFWIFVSLYFIFFHSLS